MPHFWATRREPMFSARHEADTRQALPPNMKSSAARAASVA